MKAKHSFQDSADFDANTTSKYSVPIRRGFAFFGILRTTHHLPTGPALVVVLALLSQACFAPAVRVYQREIKSRTPLSLLKLKVPTGETKKADTNYTVAFVSTAYEATMEGVMKQWEAIQAQANLNTANTYGNLATGAYRRMDVAKFNYFKHIKQFLQKDLEQILLAKGVTVSGPFTTPDEMTFDNKKRAVYMFTPEISITVDTQSQNSGGSNGLPYTEEGNILVNGTIIFTLRESLTREKLWVKRIDADPISKPYRFVAKFKEPYVTEETLTMMGIPLGGKKLEEKDDTDQVLAQALSAFYQALGDKLWAHIDAEEWSKYLAQAENLRKDKRF